MKKVLILLTISLSTNLIFAQNVMYDRVLTQFEDEYNSENYNLIFSLFSEEMQQMLPLENNATFLSELKSQAGNILDKQLITSHNELVASYKVSFEKTTLSIDISINENGKINLLLLRPFHEIKTEKTTLINHLGNLPKEQSDMVFNHIKVFPNNTQLAIALIKNEVTEFYGVVKHNGIIEQINNKDNVFEIGSISKVFTATLLANAILSEKIKIEDNINKFYDFTFNNNINLNFKCLANHTSRLEQFPSNLNIPKCLMENTKIGISNPYGEYEDEKIESYLKTGLKLTDTLEGQYSYSNVGVGLLGYTLGKVENSNYEKLLYMQIFNKYGMTNSHTSIKRLKTELVKGLDSDGYETVNWEWNSSVLLGAGGILSTVADLSKFANAQFNTDNKELAMTRIPTINVNDSMEIGLGWHIIKIENNQNLYFHNGGTGGYSSSIILDIDKKDGVIILSNVSTFNPDMGNIDNLCFELMKTLKE